ncbi:metal-dependent transcriptional regulator [Xanthovirga aplysinae]|uniref:metal-dependent transcriptional regulator n=1 Tax=Xanthovirga aplysinae TaxID=2529853 RepID=UPI0012BC562F|nr:metal-dependent transcriptional regulator [Xanthovirga aplysinae]MTI29531.1 metal-dependent transcriptional regulator [Xanthovirga aplysinae]
MLSLSEENYLKTIYHLSEAGKSAVSTNAIAEALQTKPASVTDMIRKLNTKEYITYVRYKGVNISEQGKMAALMIIRKHRLWEFFLVDKLKFNWDEVHEVAEQLEHIKSPLLIRRLDEFLGFPKYDPHGDPIPDENGKMNIRVKHPLCKLNINEGGIIAAVKDSSPAFLQYLDKVGAYLGAHVQILDKIEFDNSLEIQIDQQAPIFVSREVSESILISHDE